VRAEVGRLTEVSLLASDPDGDPIRFFADHMPQGMAIDSDSANHAVLRWRPEDSQEGDQEAVIYVSDGRSTSARTIRFKVTPSREWSWDGAAMPGLQYTAYIPKDRGNWGIFHGPSFEFLLAGWIHQNKKSGPSHGRVYIDFDFLTNEKSHVSSAFNVVFGATASLERFPNRDWAIPFFGLEAGGLYQKQSGSFGQITPLVGLHLYAQKFVFVSATGGYLFPMSSNRFDELRGYRAKLGLDFVLW
jgi:hypothetical protein